MSESIDNRDSSRVSDLVFSEALRAITEGRAQARRGVVVAFRGSLADVMYSKSVMRLTAFWKAVSGTELAAKVRKSILIFSGGCRYQATAKGVDRIYQPEASCLAFDAKQGWIFKGDISPEAFGAACAVYEGVKSFDYDAITVKAAPSQVRLEPVVKALRAMRDKRVDLPREERERFIKLWDYACSLFPELAGMELTARVVDKPVSGDGSAEATMPAKPTRRRTKVNA